MRKLLTSLLFLSCITTVAFANTFEIAPDARMDIAIPDTLYTLSVTPAGVTETDIIKALSQHFTLGESFTKMFTPTGVFAYNALANNYSPMTTLSQPLASLEYNDLSASAMAFLDSLCIAYDPLPTYATYGTIKNNAFTPCAKEVDTRYALQLSLVLNGVPIAPTEPVTATYSVPQDALITTMPYAAFSFDESGRLLSMRVNAYAISASTLSTHAIVSWEDTLTNWLNQNEWADILTTHSLVIHHVQFSYLGDTGNTFCPAWYYEIRLREMQTSEELHATLALEAYCR